MAQVPGYMGKRLVLTSDNSFGASAFLLEKAWLRYGGTLEFVIKKNQSIGFNYQYNRSKINLEIQDNHFTYPFVHLKSNRFGLEYGWYKGIAPLGQYVKLHLFYEFQYADDLYANRQIINPDLTDPYAFIIDSEEIRGSNFGFAVSFGKRRIIANRIIVGYGFSVGQSLSFPQLGIFDLFDIESSISELNTLGTEYYNKVSFNNIVMDFCSFDLSIGLVL
jgi:hypothetical protein